MDFVTRLASGETTFNYPLEITSAPIWQQQTPGIWSLTIALPEVPAEHFVVPSFAWHTEDQYAFQFTWCANENEHPLHPVPGGEQAKPAPPAGTNLAVSSHIDCWHTHQSVAPSHIRLSVNSQCEPTTCLVTTRVRPLVISPVTAPKEALDVVAFEPQPISQMTAKDEIKQRICSPTALTMALSRFHNAPNWLNTVEACYDPQTKAYGSWPLAIQWASKHGIIGAVEALSNWTDAVTILATGTPLVCSIRFGKGELVGAPLQQTGGHLVLVYGIRGDQVLVKDPAGSNDEEVDRAYCLQEFSSAWLSRRGAAYIFAPSNLSLGLP